MNIPWPDTRCIVCVTEQPLTKEHVIPDSLGGVLTSHFLCAPCNSRLGHEFEAGVKQDTVIRLAMEAVRPRVPALIKSISARLATIADSPRGPVRGSLTAEGDFVPRASREPDGSLIQPTDHARRNIAHMMRQDGIFEAEIASALQRFDDAAENTRVPISADYDIIKWSITKVRPALDTPEISPIVPLKIAYEYMALHLGTAVFDWRLDPIRAFLRNDATLANTWRIERLVVLPYAPFHGLVVEENAPHGVVQIRLFGGVVFRVHFLDTGFQGVRLKYTHDLEHGREAAQEVG
jgi:hypothetical protein